MSGKVYRGKETGYTDCIGHIDHEGNVYNDPKTEYLSEHVGHIGTDNCIYRGKKPAWGEEGQPVGHYDGEGNIYTGRPSAWGEKGQPIAHRGRDGKIYAGAMKYWGEKGQPIGSVESGQIADCAAAVLLLLDAGQSEDTGVAKKSGSGFWGTGFGIFLIIVIGLAIGSFLESISIPGLLLMLAVVGGAVCLGIYLRKKVNNGTAAVNPFKKDAAKKAAAKQPQQPKQRPAAVKQPPRPKKEPTAAKKKKDTTNCFHHADATHNYFSCPNCRTVLRVPKGKGRIQITCAKCGTRFQVND